MSFARECNFQTGEERWGIKTSLPAGALDRTAKQIDLESLMDLANPPLSTQQKNAIKDRRWTGRVTVADSDENDISVREGDIVSIEGFLYRARCQRDGDYHLEVGVRNRMGSPCLIVEAPDPNQIESAALKERATEVRRNLNTLPSGIFTGGANARPVQVQIAGQLFLDAPHIRRGDPSGGRGTRHCATNVWEIHPLTVFSVMNP